MDTYVCKTCGVEAKLDANLKVVEINHRLQPGTFKQHGQIFIGSYRFPSHPDCELAKPGPVDVTKLKKED